MSQQMTKPGKALTSAVARDVASTSPLLDFGHAWDYAPAPEGTDHIVIQPRYELFIGGKWRAPKSGKYFQTVSPSTEQSSTTDQGSDGGC